MQTLLLVATGSTNNFHTDLDLFDDVPINLVIQEGDLSGFERRSNYTKTFRIPATAKNSKVFKNFFEINGTQYNPLNSLPCVVQNMGNDIFKGTLRLNGVYRNELYDEYEVYIIQELVDFTNLLGDLTLSELEWSDLNHSVDYDNITTSWYADSGDTAGLFGGRILYPMINYGLEYTSGTPDFDYCIGSSPCFSNSANALPERIWRPAIRIKEVFDRIIEYTGYIVDSEFLNSPYFRSLYMDLGYGNILGPQVPDTSENLNLFKVYTNTQVFQSYAGTLEPNYSVVPFNRTSPDGYDPLDNYQFNQRRFKVPKSGEYGFNIRLAYTKVGTFNEELKFRIDVKASQDPNDIENGTQIATSDWLDATDNDKQLLLPFTATLTAGDFVQVLVQFDSSAGVGYNQTQTLILKAYDANYAAPQWLLYDSPELLTTDVDINLNMPDEKAIDWIKNIINMFNLVFLVKDERVITVEPFTLYFDDDTRTVKDWTGKLDISKDYEIEPFSFDLPKEIRYTYLDAGNEYPALYYQNNFNKRFGERTLIKDSNILQGEDVLEVQFRPVPTNTIDGSDYVIMPRFFQRTSSTPQQKVATQTKPHIFFWVGNRYMYTAEGGSGNASWWLQSGTTQVEWTTYPAVSHLSKLDPGQGFQQFSDLSFRPAWDFFANSNTVIGQFTSNNLYENFHEESYNEKYSEEARKLNGRFYLQPNEVGQIDLRDKIFVKDSFFRIERIEEASLTDDKLTQVTLIKDLGGFEYDEPPAPTYPVAPNQAFPAPTPSPSPLPCQSHTVYGPNISKDVVCDRTAATSTVYSRSSTISDGDKVYTDSGCSSAVQVARYLDPTTSPTGSVFVVSNPDGTVSSDSC